MRESTKEQLKKIAPDLIAGKKPVPCPISVQRAIAILEILKDGNWHTSQEIGDRLGLGQKYVKEILMSCKLAWGLTSSKGAKGGWKL